MQKLAEIVLDFIELLALTDEEQLDSDAALKMLEGISGSLRDASPEERKALSEAAAARLKSLLREPDEYGYSPRKLVTPEHRQLLESIASGEEFTGT